MIDPQPIQPTPPAPPAQSVTPTPPSPSPSESPKPPSMISNTPPPLMSDESGVKKSPFRYLLPVIVILLILVVAGVIISQVRNRSTSVDSDTPTTITYWGLWEPSEVLQSIISDFESQNPNISVVYQQQSHTDYRQRLQNALKSTDGPDIARFHHSWLPMIGAELSPIPEDVYSLSDYQATFYKVASQWLVSGKDIKGIPLMIDGLGLYYNVDVLQAAGMAPPTSWDELRRIAKQLTLSNDKQILRAGVAMGTTENVEHWSDIVGLMLLQNGADPAKPNNQLGQDAITFYTLFSKSDQIWDDSLPNSTVAFATEKVVMMLAPSWRAHEVASINPDLNFKIAPAPKLPDTEITWASFWAEGVNANAPKQRQAAAFAFLKYLSQKETMRRLYAASSDYPGRLFGEPFSRVDLADQVIADPLVGAYITQASTAQSWYLNSYTHDNGINDQISKYYQDAINTVLTGESVSAALTTAETGITQTLSQFRVTPSR